MRTRRASRGRSPRGSRGGRARRPRATSRARSTRSGAPGSRGPRTPRARWCRTARRRPPTRPTRPAPSPARPTRSRRRTRSIAQRTRKAAATHLIPMAAIQATPARFGRPRAASASAPTTRSIITASLCPPPPKWSASNGFQPTNAAANAGRAASDAARTAVPEHGNRGDQAEQPGRPLGILARDACVELRAEREQRAVERRRVAPRAAHRRVGDVSRIRARRIAVGIAALHRADATVHPVRPRVGGEERRAGKRQELDGGGDHEHDEDRRSPPAQEDEANGVTEERDREPCAERDAPPPGGVDR